MNMKSRLLIGLASLTLSTGAFANDGSTWVNLLISALDTSFAQSDGSFRSRNVDLQRDRYEDPRHDRYVRPLTLYTKVKVNGDYRIPLRRLIEEQHGINTRDYRIRSITVHNKARYPACADLQIGGRNTGSIDLNRGTTHINAPRGRPDGKWVLEVGAARVRGITIALEPRRQLARNGHRVDGRFGR
jgi:hypothetical protein